MSYSSVNSSFNLRDRYFIASIKSTKIAFSADLIRDILDFERGQILAFPAYNSSLLGVFYYQNEIVPVVSIQKILNIPGTVLLRSSLIAVRLNAIAGKLANVALVVERMEKSLNFDELSSEYQFKLEDIPEKIWQPQF